MTTAPLSSLGHIPSPANAADSTALIAGAIGGSIVVLAIIIVAVVCLTRRSRRPKTASAMPARSGGSEMVSARNEYGQFLSTSYADSTAAFKEGLPQVSNYNQLPAAASESPYATTAANFMTSGTQAPTYASMADEMPVADSGVK